MDRRYFSCAALASYDDSESPDNPGRVFSSRGGQPACWPMIAGSIRRGSTACREP